MNRALVENSSFYFTHFRIKTVELKAFTEILVAVFQDKIFNGVLNLNDLQVIEVELAKLKVMVNDIQAHQSSVDTLNDAGRQIIESDKGSREASNTQQKLNELNTKWNDLLGAAEGRQVELEDALKEAQAFAQEIQVSHMFLNVPLSAGYMIVFLS